MRRKEKELIYEKWSGLLRGNARLQLLFCNSFQVLLDQTIRGGVTNEEGAVPVSLSADFRENGTEFTNVSINCGACMPVAAGTYKGTGRADPGGNSHDDGLEFCRSRPCVLESSIHPEGLLEKGSFDLGG